MINKFNGYVNAYNLNNECIKLKYDHSYRVMNSSNKYAKLLNFNQEDIELATIIGLLHDIGRFEQYKKYNSFSDLNTIDHADYSVYELFDNNKIEDFNIKKEYYPIIKFSIKNHNKLKIEKTTNERMIKQAKLIRDIDKLDILYTLGYLGCLDYISDDSEISSEVIKCIKSHKTIDRKLVKTNNDKIAFHMAYVFDINNNIILKEMKTNLEYYYKKIKDNKLIFKDIYNEINNYIDNRKE